MALLPSFKFKVPRFKDVFKMSSPVSANFENLEVPKNLLNAFTPTLPAAFALAAVAAAKPLVAKPVRNI